MASEPPPFLAVGEHDGLRRVHFRLWQLLWTAITVLVTGWLCTLGWLPAILALMVAKHVLVAILVAGLGLDASLATPSSRAEQSPS